MATDRVLTFFGPMRAPHTVNLRMMLCGMVNDGAQKVTVLFASEGGSIDDGIALHTYLRALPFELTLHAVGMVSSVAVPVFLAAPTRLASKNAAFMFHEYTWTNAQPSAVTQSTLAEQTAILDHGIAWAKKIIKATTKLTDKDFKAREMFKKVLILDAASAAADGLVSAIAEPKILQANDPRVVA